MEFNRRRMTNFQDKANFIWQVADDILFGPFMHNEFRDVVLPFLVLRRLDCVLEDKKDAVIETHKKFKDKPPRPEPGASESDWRSQILQYVLL